MCNCMCKKLVVAGLMVAAIYMFKKKICCMNTCDCKDRFKDIAKETKDEAGKIGREVINDIASDMKDAAKDVKTLAKDSATDVKNLAKDMTSSGQTSH